MAITNKHLLQKAAKLLPEIEQGMQTHGVAGNFITDINGIATLHPGVPCVAPCSFIPEVIDGPNGRELIFVCRRPDGDLC